MNLAGMLSDLARRIPEHVAITEGDRATTFAELSLRAGGLSRSLTERYDLRPGDRIVVFLENCAAFLEILYAAWTGGYCVVPINSKLHEQEVLHILKDSGARLCFTTSEKKSRLQPLLSTVVELTAVISTDSPEYEHLLQGAAYPIRTVEPEDPAWIFYTSGTTGKPKGATLSFRNLLFMTQCYYSDIDRPDVGDTKLHAAPLSHGSGLYSLPHLLKGGRQVILGGFSPADIFEAIENHPNVSMFAAPTMISRLLDHEGAATADLTNLRVLYFGGGPMYVSELRRALMLFGERLYHLYGQGESPMTITGFRPQLSDMQPRSTGEDRLASCGYPRMGVDYRIVDPQGQEVPFGETGEVITRSDCMMEGYWGNAEATSKAIRQGWLWTGDLGACDGEGFLYLKDRSKDLIISGGTNIYPREIEDVLLTHPDVLECSVVGRPHPVWGEEVVAFVVMKQGRTFDAELLDQHITSHIARFKRPKVYRTVGHLPKNNYGKVLKTALRKSLSEEGI